MKQSAIFIGLVFMPAIASAANWEYVQSPDPISDKMSAIAHVRGQGGTLGIKCDEAGPGSVYVALISDKYLGGRGIRSDYRSVLIRADEEPAQSTIAAYNRSAVLLNDQQQLPALVSKLTLAKRLVFRVSTYDYRIIDVVFDDLGGGPDAIVRVFKACDPEGLNRMMGRKIL